MAIGDSFLWLSEANTKFETNYADIQPALVGIESLRVHKIACDSLKLSDSQVEAIFFGNAAAMYGVT